MLVMLATLLGLLTTFSPLKPTLLMVLFTFGFVFATLMYVFVLPNMVHGWELALFIFLYTFIAFYLINPKLTIFFLLGMFVLGISNDMHYNFDVFLSTLLIFYMFLTILMFFYNFPFSSRPEYLFRMMKKRILYHAIALLERSSMKSSWFTDISIAYHQHHLHASSAKLNLWGSKIDTNYFNANSTKQIMTFVASCKRLTYTLQLLCDNDRQNEKNNLLKSVRNLQGHALMSEMMEALSDEKSQSSHEVFEGNVEQIEAKINGFKEALNPEDFTMEELSGFYVNLGLRHHVWNALIQCHHSMQEVDWNNLKANRF